MQNEKIKAGKDEELAVRHWRDWAEVEGKHEVCVLTFLNIHIFMVSHIRKKVEILIPTNVIMLIPIKLFKLIDRFIPFWWEEELCLSLSEFRDHRRFFFRELSKNKKSNQTRKVYINSFCHF